MGLWRIAVTMSVVIEAWHSKKGYPGNRHMLVSHFGNAVDGFSICSRPLASFECIGGMKDQNSLYTHYHTDFLGNNRWIASAALLKQLDRQADFPVRPCATYRATIDSY
jgi:hypothetical protein